MLPSFPPSVLPSLPPQAYPYLPPQLHPALPPLTSPTASGAIFERQLSLRHFSLNRPPRLD